VSSIPQPSLFDAKHCSRCGLLKARSEFHKNRSQPDGLQAYCKPCQNAKVRERYFADVEKSRAEAREKTKRYIDRNKEKVRQRYRDWYAKSGADWHRQWQPEHRERTNELKRERRRANPEKTNAETKHRHAMRLGAEGSHTQAEWDALCEQHGGICLACGEAKPLTRDHVVPLTKGGGDGIDNIQPLCMPCNARKGTRSTDYRPPAG
jgi:5-methylcytosine-specific restriction endonuclease McrA